MKLTSSTDNEFMIEWILRLRDEEADLIMVDMVAFEMRKKLKEKRIAGRTGWFGVHYNRDQLLSMLNEHVAKGDMVDVLNIAGMILAREKLYQNG